ncbi:respiratory chain complex I subunit 1 family protein [candidate division KSB1 bacterium]
MKEILLYAFYLVIFPGILFTAVIGLVSTWVDRKVSAKVQWRQGPPFFQPFWDVLKLMGKQVIVPDESRSTGFLVFPLLGFIGAIIASMTLWLANLYPEQGFLGDLIVVVYFLTLPSIAIIMGGVSSSNPVAALGASREIKLVLAYELPFITAIAVAIYKFGTFSLTGIVNGQAETGAVIYSLSGVLAFITALLASHAKQAFIPFDMAEAECEIAEGAILEYSGVILGVIKLTQAILLFIMPVFLITVFWGGIEINVSGILYFILKYVLILVVYILIKNTNPRVRIDHAMRFFWGPIMGLAVLSLILSFLGL